MEELDADSALYVVDLVAGVGEGVVGCAAAELVALAEFASDDDAECQSGDSCGNEADVAEHSTIPARGKPRALLDPVPDLTERTTELHGLHHSAEG